MSKEDRSLLSLSLRHVDAKILGGVEEQATKEIEKK
jgi:hypothetical protein